MTEKNNRRNVKFHQTMSFCLAKEQYRSYRKGIYIDLHVMDKKKWNEEKEKRQTRVAWWFYRSTT